MKFGDHKNLIFLGSLFCFIYLYLFIYMQASSLENLCKNQDDWKMVKKQTSSVSFVYVSFTSDGQVYVEA